MPRSWGRRCVEHTVVRAGMDQDALYMGNLDARRDWGYAKEYVEIEAPT